MREWLNRTHVGDCRELLKQMAADGVRVQTCVTSPPYFGLRDYGVEGQIGLEPTPAEYVERMVDVFRAVRDVLTDDGTLWLNLGDSYSSGGRKDGAKPKDLLGIPWRVALALQADGWYLRSDIIWHKPNPLPESVTDRPTKAHEYVFLLSKSERYYYDANSIKERATDTGRLSGIDGRDERAEARPPGSSARTFARIDYSSRGRNKRAVWTIPTAPFSGAHFATFPRALVEPCILAGSRAGDIVLDPFMGSGTTAEVATRFGREFLGCELNPKYVELHEMRRTTVGMPL